MLKLEIKTGGSAFSEDGENISFEGRCELSEILKAIGQRIEDGYNEGKIIDINGNRCGEWKLD